MEKMQLNLIGKTNFLLKKFLFLPIKVLGEIINMKNQSEKQSKSLKNIQNKKDKSYVENEPLSF